MLRKYFLMFICLYSYAYSIEQISPNPKDVMSFVSKYLPNNPIILEAGGFDGTDTELMVKFWPNSTIYTFEPVPVLFDTLSKRTKKYPNIYVYNVALGDRDEIMNMWVSFHPWGDNSGSSSLLPPKDHLEFDPSEFKEVVETQVYKLDTWALSQNVDFLDFMWLDMQGFELNMLQCSEKALTAKVIYIEVGFVEMYEGQFIYSDVKKWMTENGYELIAIDFDEEVSLKGRETIWPGNGILYFGNCVFLKK